MIQQQTVLKVLDNSGAKFVRCIKVLGGFKRKIAFTGDIIVVSVISLRNKSKITSRVKKGEVHKALIIKCKKYKDKKTGFNLSLSNNAVCLLNKQNKPISTRIFGPVPRLLKKHKWLKVLSLSSGIL
jgi:large subunit ribosomal protein L14